MNISSYYWILIISSTVYVETLANESAKRLFDDLMRHYNKLKRPSPGPKLPLPLKIAVKLTQIIDVHEKNQIMTSIVWLKQIWRDNALKWSPATYSNISVLYVPSELIWTPDIVLYNNADGAFNITICTKATVHHTGEVIWEPPAIFTSICMIDVKWFPFDIQNCNLRFGSWSYDHRLIDMDHLSDKSEIKEVFDERLGVMQNMSVLEKGIDLSDYYPSGEWDILETPATRRFKEYVYDPFALVPVNSTWIDIVYRVKLRRKPLFYTVNLVFPCVFISFCTISVFYLPSESGEKIGLSISILVSLTVFYLLLVCSHRPHLIIKKLLEVRQIDIVPATSVVLPLIGKYLLFTMSMVTMSVFVTVVALNLHFRKPSTHRMPKWVKELFLKKLPKYLMMPRPLEDDETSFRRMSSRMKEKELQAKQGDQFYGKYALNYHTELHTGGEYGHISKNPADQMQPSPMKRTSRTPSKRQQMFTLNEDEASGSASPAPNIRRRASSRKERIAQLYLNPTVLKAFENLCFISDLLKKKDRDDKVDEDWKFVAMVFDRLFLWMFSVTCVFGTLIILLGAPALTNTQPPADQKYHPGKNLNEMLTSAKDNLPHELAQFLA